MKKFLVTDLETAQDFSLCGVKINRIHRVGGKVEDDDGANIWTESIFVSTECESIKVDIRAKGRWAPIVNQQTRKPYGLVFKSKQTAPMRILIVAPTT